MIDEKTVTVTLIYGETPDIYYKYGKTRDNQTDHC